MLALTIDFRVAGRAGRLEHPIVCHTCEALVFTDESGDEFDVVAETRLCELRLLAFRQRKLKMQPDRCWSCSRPASSVALTWQDATFNEARLENPTICPTCVALLGLGVFGFAAADDDFYAARLEVIAALAKAPNTPAPMLESRRQRGDDLILVKAALLERDSHDFMLGDDGGYDYLARELGLSLKETESEVARILAQPEPLLVLRAVEGVLAPRLNARGWLRVRGLQKIHREDPPDQRASSLSRSLRRALERLDTAAVEAA